VSAKWKAEQQKQRREQAIANTTGIRALAAIAALLRKLTWKQRIPDDRRIKES
jgi:hypothetical protein